MYIMQKLFQYCSVNLTTVLSDFFISKNILIPLYFKMVLSFYVIITNSAAGAKSLQLCPTLCDPIDGSPPGSPVPGILQTRTRTLEWVAISFSNA